MNNNREKFDVVIVANGVSARMGFDKLAFNLGETTVLNRSIQAFSSLIGVGKIIVVCDRDVDAGSAVRVGGGKTRSESVACGLAQVTAPYVLIHDGARPFVTRELIERVARDVIEYGSAVPVIPVVDTVLCENQPVNREKYRLVQTPQGFRTEDIKRAYALSNGASETDDSTLYARFIGTPHYTDGETQNKKITRPEDLLGANSFVGTGFDVHKLVFGRPLRLGGITVPCEYGEEAHSDGDVVIHALMDALLAACGLPDIGHLFPENDEKYENVDSTILLREVAAKVADKNRKLLSADIVVLLQKPKIAPYLANMRRTLADVLAVSVEKINLSATTTETIGLIGRNEAVAALAVCNLL